MSTEFLPFVPSSAQIEPSGEFQARVIPHGATKGSSAPASGGISNAASGVRQKCEPKVTVERVGDRVTRIQVQCSCGEVIDLSCVY